MKRFFWILLLIASITFTMEGCSLFSTRIKKTIPLVEQQIKVTKAFAEQIQAVWTKSEDQQEKIDNFENSVNDMLKAYYETYKEKGEEGLQKAKEEITSFLSKLETEGVHLSENSIPYYLERFEKMIQQDKQPNQT